MVKICLARLKLNGLRETLNGFLEVPLSVQAYAFIVVCECVVWIYLDCKRVVLNGKVELSYLIICEPSVEQSLEVTRHDFKGFAVELYGFIVVSLLPSCVTLRVVDFSLLLLLLSIWA